jgi:phosphoenolpyruvate carboxykinase (GTP)
MWPGFGENSRVLKWIFDRCDNLSEAKLSPIGYMPTIDAIDQTGLSIESETLERLTDINVSEWLEEVKSIREYYQMIGEKLPKELHDELNQLERRLIISSNQLTGLIKQKKQ